MNTSILPGVYLQIYRGAIRGATPEASAPTSDTTGTVTP